MTQSSEELNFSLPPIITNQRVITLKDSDGNQFHYWTDAGNIPELLRRLQVRNEKLHQRGLQRLDRSAAVRNTKVVIK